MAVTAAVYGRLPLSLFAKEVSWLSDTMKVMLTTVTYVPNQDTHQYKSSVTNEIAATGGYTATGATLASKTITYTDATNVTMLDAADVQYAASTITARVAVVYDATPATDATRPLLCYQLSDADVSSSGGNWDLAWNAAGIVTFTAGAAA